MTKKIIIILIIAFGVMQLIPVSDRLEPQPDNEGDFIAMVQPPENVSHMLETACYDCHSNRPNFPWYAELAPISWWIDSHVEEARSHLNFSDWGSYDAKKADHKLEECVELVESHEMPLESYTWMHDDARFTQEQREELITFFQDLRQQQATGI